MDVSRVSFPSGPGIVVRRVRYTGPGGGGARHRVLDALDRLDPDTGPTAAAILVVRRVNAAVTGSPARVEGVDLRQVARLAARPAAGPIPAGCAAVLFADEAELVACLAGDIAAGGPLGWWWQVLFGRDGTPPHPAATVVEVFTRFARALPAAAAIAPRAIAAAATLIDPIELARILALTADEHAAPALAGVARGWARRGAGPARAPGRRERFAVPGRAAPAEATRPEPPWEMWWPARAAVPGVADAFVGSAIALWRAPTVARSAAYAAAVSGVLDGTGGVAIPEVGEPRHRANRAVDGDEPVAEPVPARPGPVDAAGPVQISAPVRPAGPEPAATTRTETVRSRLGGAVYLLALLDLVDLPAAANGAGEPGALLTRWQVLSLALLAFGADPRDDLFAALDRLHEAHPDTSATDAGDRHPWAYRLPSGVRAWFGPPAAPWRWSGAGGRLVVTDPAIGAGLVIADVPRRPDGAAQARQEAARAWPSDTSPALAGGPVRLTADPGPTRWSAALAGLLTALLERAGLDRRIVEVPATIEVSALHFRVHLRVDSADPRVRRAGLDRDPGWVPALGRIVELVFS